MTSQQRTLCISDIVGEHRVITDGLIPEQVAGRVLRIVQNEGVNT